MIDGREGGSGTENMGRGVCKRVVATSCTTVNPPRCASSKESARYKGQQAEKRGRGCSQGNVVRA